MGPSTLSVPSPPLECATLKKHPSPYTALYPIKRPCDDHFLSMRCNGFCLGCREKVSWCFRFGVFHFLLIKEGRSSDHQPVPFFFLGAKIGCQRWRRHLATKKQKPHVEGSRTESQGPGSEDSPDSLTALFHLSLKNNSQSRGLKPA
jgi:hypothetical protein